MTVAQQKRARYREVTVVPDGDDYESDIAQVVAAAPPLSDAQRDRLSALLRD